MMIFKNTELNFENVSVAIETDNIGSGALVRVTEFIIDRNEAGEEVQKGKNVVEVYLAIEEIKALAASLNQMLGEELENE
ncbi:hypothetical protein [Sutcliffiella halmapala]|uniref:hypothetical protein n=1 Tax=Sutcliffiella halmapala TaxID=79882 RepID=UPI00099590CB|nr:hypothetical protein [Sutcliffiella halmapala]